MQRSVAPTTARRDQAIRDAALAQTQHAPVKTLDDELVEISDSVPGFGGLFVSGAEIRAYLSNPAQTAKLHDFLTRAPILAQRRDKAIRVIPGSFDFRALKGWNDQLMGVLASDPDVAWFDVYEMENRINVAVTNRSMFGLVETAVHDLGIPPDAVRTPSGSLPVIHSDFLSSIGVRPFGAGMLITVYGSSVDGYNPFAAGCSAGPTVWNGAGFHWMLVNSHCTAVLWSEDYVPSGGATSA